MVIEDQARKRREAREAGKRKADTVCHNDAYDYAMKQRTVSDVQDFQIKNLESLREMSPGRPPKERLIIPDDVEVFYYGNQKLNIWEV